MDCEVGYCRIPRPHEHTGMYEVSSITVYYCPSDDVWTLCSGPCPDGTPHSEAREEPVSSEIINIL